MAEQDQQQQTQDLQFGSEEAKLEALNAIEETPENIEQIERVQNAPVVAPSSEEGGETPASPEPPPVGGEEKGGEQPKQEQQQRQPTGDTPPAVPNAWTVTAEDLPTGPNGETYKTPAELFKAFAHQGALTKRQTDYIREHLGTQPAQDMQHIQQLETQIADLRKQLEQRGVDKGAQQERTEGSGTEQKLEQAQGTLDDLLKELDELDKAEDPFDEKVLGQRNNLSRRIVQATANVQQLTQRQATELQSLRDEIGTIRTRVDETHTALQSSNEENQRKRAREAVSAEMSVMDKFAGANPEFSLSKPAAEVDNEYTEWSSNVARMYYGRPPANPGEMREAVRQLQLRSPTLVNKCELAGIGTEPSADVQAYLQICELLNYRDGLRPDPMTGKWEPARRMDPATGQAVIDRFPGGLEGLEAAYTYRQKHDGVFAQQLAQARAEGGRAALAASAQRDAGAVELSGGEGSGGGTPQSQTTPQQAIEALARINEEEAAVRAKQGDPVLLDEMNRYLEVLGNSPVEVPGYQYRRTA